MPPSTASHNVPVALSGFVGRAHDLSEVSRLLDEGRLLTLTGAGGVGKTRLAREVAAGKAASDRDHRYADGVWWVELAPLLPGADVVIAVASALGVRQAPGIDALAGAIGERRLLLVLDNCEHLVDECAEVADTLLRACPALIVLATSREALGVEGEVVWSVATLEAGDAQQLFVERARAVQPGFALTERTSPAVRTIATRLDGLPLALELAAANVATFGVDALASRLDDMFALLTRGRRTGLPRHRTLRALLDWSHDLLAPAERTLLARLSVFRGEFDLDAVEAVCADASLDARATLAALGRLVEHSLVAVREQQGETRYRLLETVRQYGAARLAEDEAARRAAGERHARWVDAFTARLAGRSWSAARGRIVQELADTVEEIRAALSWSTGVDGDAMTAVRITGALAWFWFSGVPWAEARAWTATALHALDREGVPDDARPVADQAAIATALYPAAGLAYFAGDVESIVRFARRADLLWSAVERAMAADPALARALHADAVRGRAVMRQQAGLAHGMRGDLAAAMIELDAAVDVARDGGDRWLHAVMLMRRALVRVRGADLDGAMADYLASVPLLRAVGERWFLSLALEGIAVTSLARGETADAAVYAREAVAALRDEPDPWFIARGLDTMAAVAVAEAGTSRARLAARLLGAASVLRARSGTEVIGPDQARYERTVATARAALGDAFDVQWTRGQALDLDGVFALAGAPGMAVDATAEMAIPVLPVAPPPEEPSASRLQAALVLAFGPMSVVRDGVPLTPADLTPAKARELLLYLVLHPPRAKEQIALALWPDASETQVRNAFHVTLHHVRRILGHKETVTFDGTGYALARDAGDSSAVTVASDVHELLDAARAVTEADRVRATPGPDLETLDRWRERLDRAARGRLGEGVDAGDWIVEHQDRIRVHRGEAMEALARLYASSGATAASVSVLESLVAADPLREGAHRALMLAYAAGGEPARALAHFDHVSALLVRELGASPARETRALADRIRRG